MCRCAGGDQDGFNVFIFQQFVIVLNHMPDSTFVRNSLRHFQADVTNGYQVRLRDEPHNVAYVHAAHAPGPDDS